MAGRSRWPGHTELLASRFNAKRTRMMFVAEELRVSLVTAHLPLMDIRKQVNEQAEATHGNKYTVNDFVLKAVINALQAVPAVNASFNSDHIVQLTDVGHAETAHGKLRIPVVVAVHGRVVKVRGRALASPAGEMGDPIRVTYQQQCVGSSGWVVVPSIDVAADGRCR